MRHAFKLVYFKSQSGLKQCPKGGRGTFVPRVTAHTRLSRPLGAHVDAEGALWR